MTAREAPPPRAVEVSQLERESFTARYELLGEIEPWRETTLYFEVAGIVEELLVDEGHWVAAGEPLARLVQVDFQLSAEQAQAELDAAQAQLDLLEAGTRQEDLEAAEADYERARVRGVYWVNELRRIKELFEKGTVTASELDQVQREHDAAIQEERATKARWDRAVAGPRKEEIEAARAAVEARTKALELTQRQLAKATLRAPFAGRIERRLVDEGAYVNVFPTGGVPIIHLVDLQQVDALISVPEAARRHFDGQTPVTVASAMNAEIQAAGRIVSLDSVADRATGTYRLRVRLDNPDHSFQGGMVVIASIDAAPARAVLRIPPASIRQAYGQPPLVLLVDPQQNRVVSREVTLGALHEGRIEVTAGLEPGELLVVRGQHTVVPGDVVEYRVLVTEE